MIWLTMDTSALAYLIPAVFAEMASAPLHGLGRCFAERDCSAYALHQKELLAFPELFALFLLFLPLLFLVFYALFFRAMEKPERKLRK